MLIPRLLNPEEFMTVIDHMRDTAKAAVEENNIPKALAAIAEGIGLLASVQFTLSYLETSRTSPEEDA